MNNIDFEKDQTHSISKNEDLSKLSEQVLKLKDLEDEVKTKEKIGKIWFLKAIALAGLKRYDDAIDSLIVSLGVGFEAKSPGFSMINSFISLGRAKDIKKHPRWKNVKSIIEIYKKRGMAK